MSWTLLSVYFSACSVALIPFLEIYGRILLVVGKAGSVVKLVGSLVAWILISIVLVSPLFGGMMIGYDVLEIDRESYLSVIGVSMLYAMSVVPGIWFFKTRHLEKLKRLGFFVHRGGR